MTSYSSFTQQIFVENLPSTRPLCLMAESEEELKSFLMRVKGDNEKIDIELNIQKNKDLGIWSHHFMAHRRGNGGNIDRLYFLGLQTH